MGDVGASSAVHLEMTEWVTKALTIVAIVLQLMEFFYQFIDEIEYLWKMRVHLITFLYAWARYFALAVQIIIFALSEVLLHSRDEKSCWRMYILRSVTVQISTVCLEAVLMVRVHALYNCSYRSRLILVTTFSAGAFLEFAGSIISTAQIKPGPTGDLCSPEFPSAPLSLALFASGVGLIHMTVLLMTGAQYYFTRKGRRILRTPLVSLMIRDELLTFLFLGVIFACVAISELFGAYFTISVTDAGLIWNASYAWYMSLTSIAGCRMILKLRKLACQHLQHRLPCNEAALSSRTELSAIIYSDDDDDDDEPAAA